MNQVKDLIDLYYEYLCFRVLKINSAELDRLENAGRRVTGSDKTLHLLVSELHEKIEQINLPRAIYGPLLRAMTNRGKRGMFSRDTIDGENFLLFGIPIVLDGGLSQEMIILKEKEDKNANTT